MTYLEDDLSYNGVAAKGEESVHYVIYPDTLFVENFICNLLFLIFLKKLFFPAVLVLRSRRNDAIINVVCANCGVYDHEKE